MSFTELKANQFSTFCLNDYDAIGFDLDHTLCKYKLKEMSQLVYKNMCKHLVTEKKYPNDIFGSYEASARFYQRGLIIHIQKGNFLKLAKDFTILRATHGTRVLTSQEIENEYGPSRIWEPTRNLLHDLCEQKGERKPFHSLQDFFVIPAPYIAARIIDHLDKQAQRQLQEYTFWLDVYDSISDMYRREYFKENKGGYFPALRDNLPVYTEKCSKEMIDWLRNLKMEKKLFLLTGSHYDYAKFILDYIIGEDWRDIFDICVTYARKPRFFYETAEGQPFLRLEGFVETSDIVPEDSLKLGNVYSQGNWIELSAFLNRICQKPRAKVLYIGDVIIDDVYAPPHFLCCESVSILEEMVAEGMVSEECSQETTTELSTDLWGSFFLDEEGGHFKQPFWSSAVMNYARLAIPHLSALAAVPLNRRLPSFVPHTSNTNVFYPGPPTVYGRNKVNSKM